MICKKCNTEIRNDAKFCPKCGANIAEENQDDSPSPNPTIPSKTKSSITSYKVFTIIACVIITIIGVIMYEQHEEQLKEQQLQEELRANDLQVLENVKSFISAGEWEKATKEAEHMRSHVYGKEIEAMQAYADAVIAIQKKRFKRSTKIYG